MRQLLRLAPAVLALGLAAGLTPVAPGGDAWPSWRGPHQDGTSKETNLPDRWEPGGVNDLWSYDIAGRGTPAIAGGRVYALGYEGEGADLQEVLLCLDERTGAKIWDRRFSDFLSDSIYTRYAIGAPTVDPRTGNVFWLTTAGLLNCFDRDGTLLWQHSMMEEHGRLTFPNGRTGAVVMDGDLVIARGITTSWGPLGPARDRFYGFDAVTGDLVWVSTPGIGPKDSCFSHPVLGWSNGRRVLYAGTGCGNVVCIDARVGDPIWRFPMSIGGVNASVLLHDDSLVAIHGLENLDSSVIGRMVAIELGAEPAPGAPGPVVLGRDQEQWRNDLVSFSSSPVLVDDRVYVTVKTGELCCVDVTSGAVLWSEKLATDQIHASPVYGDGKLYVPMNDGDFYIVEPSDEGAHILTKVKLEGNCLGAPAIASGRVYVHTTSKLYCFGRDGDTTPAPPMMAASLVPVGDPTRVLCVPAEMLVQPGDTLAPNLRGVDDKGYSVANAFEGVTWSGPPTLGLHAMDDGSLHIEPSTAPTAGVMTGTWNGLEAKTRVRIVPALPFTENFDDIEPAIPHKAEAGVKFAFPPASWIGARLKWEVRDVGGDRVLAKTLDRALFQRSMVFIGHPDMRDYTMQVDIMSDGNRRSMSTAGVINQRYMVLLKGNHQEIEITSNHERIKEHVPFKWKPKQWIRLKSRIDQRADGSTLVRAKAWPRDTAEPAAWNITYTHRHGHANGAPGLFGFSPQSRFRVYIDNIDVTPND